MKRTKMMGMLALMVAVLMVVPYATALGLSDDGAADSGKALVASSLTTAAANDDGKAIYDKYMRTESPENYEDQSYEPYGYGKDVPFFLNKQSELLFYVTSKDSSGSIISFFEKLKSGYTNNVLNAGTRVDPLQAPPATLKRAYFVQAVAFDPTGSGRDDHIAFIGACYDGGKARCYLWAYNTVKRVWTGPFNMGAYNDMRVQWMIQEDVTDYEAANFFSITAGDYDGDGKDTLVAYCGFDGYDGFSLYELESYSADLTEFRLNYFADKSKGTALVQDRYDSNLSGKDIATTKMACEVETGDVNGDGLDDLVALTYIGNWNDNDRTLETYRPCVRISYGKEGFTGFTQKCDYGFAAWHWHEGWWWHSMVSPGMDVGDIDRDGQDEIVVAGIKCDMKKKTTDTSERIHDDIDNSKIYAFVFKGIEGGFWADMELDANAWTTSGFYKNEEIWTKTAVQCAAVNGVGNAEMVFISGTLYKWENGGLQAVHTPEYFQSSGDNLSSKVSTNMFVQSTAAGNFEGNDKGYEQIAFTVSCKTSGKESYDYLRGIIGGKDYNNVTGVAGNYYSTSKDYMDDDAAWPGRGRDNYSGTVDEQQGLNCIAIACDCDNDGALARYKDKALIYADPEVMCVLQAPPYFSQMADYLTDSSSTKYEITNTYEFESTKSDSVSYGVGVVAGAESPAFQMEVTAGYALDWTKEFSEGLSESINVGWNAKEVDLVVVMRKPVVSYTYQLQSSDGTWGDECVVITVPCEPDYQQMSISQYNQFANYYNETMKKFTSDFHKLDTLNNEWLGHEGDPQKYIKWTNNKFKTDSAYKIIQPTALNFGHNGESVEWGKSTGSSAGVTESMSHGFTYDLAVAMGPNAGVASMYVGLSTSLQYMAGHSTSQTHIQEQGISCEINALKADTPSSVKPLEYNFSFKMARWPSGIKRYVNGKAEDVPVYGYALSGVTLPESITGVSVVDQLAAAKVDENISELPKLEELTEADEAAVAAAKESYDALSYDAKTLINVDELEALLSRIELLKAGGLDLNGAKVALSKAAFTYNGKVQKPSITGVNGYLLAEGLDYTLAWSNASSKDAGTYTVTLTGKGICSGSVKATYKIDKAANSLSAKGKTVPVKLKKLKKRAQTLGVAKVVEFADKGQGKLSYKKASGNKKIVVNKKSGKVTVKKGLKKGAYKVVVKIAAAGDTNYNKVTKKVTFKVKVK